MEKLLLDTDIESFIDIDDALALLYALKSDKLDVKAVTTVYGNTHIRSKLVRKILESTKDTQHIPVYTGESIPIRSAFPLVIKSGLEGSGLLTEQESNEPEPENLESAVDFLVNELTDNPNQCKIATIGAMTNLAKALQKKPEIAANIMHHYIMGGIIYNQEDHKKTLCFPDYNIACDVEAAQIAFNSDTPKTLIPSNITRNAKINRNDLSSLRNTDPLNQAIGKLVDVWFNSRDASKDEKVHYTTMHDLLTIIAITHPQIFQFKNIPIHVDDEGVTTINPKGKEMRVATGFDYTRFRQVFLDTIYRS